MAKRGKRAELADWIGRERPASIGETEYEALRSLLAPISGSYLRRLLRGCGVPLTPLVEGVRQESFETLEASLSTLLDEYEHGDPARRAAVRGLVIAAKEHARWASRHARRASSKEDKRAEKEEMILWMLTWLENPPLFPEWVRLRQAVR